MVDNTLCILLVLLAGYLSFIFGYYVQISTSYIFVIMIFILIPVVIFAIFKSRSKLSSNSINKSLIKLIAVLISIATLILIILITGSIFIRDYHSEELWGLLSTCLAILGLVLVLHDKEKEDNNII